MTVALTHLSLLLFALFLMLEVLSSKEGKDRISNYTTPYPISLLKGRSVGLKAILSDFKVSHTPPPFPPAFSLCLSFTPFAFARFGKNKKKKQKDRKRESLIQQFPTVKKAMSSTVNRYLSQVVTSKQRSLLTAKIAQASPTQIKISLPSFFFRFPRTKKP